MKLIIAIIQPDRMDEVLERLTDKKIHLVTVSTVMGRGRQGGIAQVYRCLLYTSPSPRDRQKSRMPSSA